MRRRHKRYSDLSQLKNQVEKLLNSPLQPIAQYYQTALDIAFNWELPEGEREELLKHISDVFDKLPTVYDKRFFLDAYLIRSITEAWSEGPVKCSRMIVPTYARHEWLCLRVPVVVTSQYDFYLINIPRATVEEIPNLLDYAWLCHELGHYLMVKHGERLFNEFLQRLEVTMQGLRIRSIADQGVARLQSQGMIEKIEGFWNPSPIHGWAHELMIDALALWCLGPVYLDTFHFEHKEREPFVLQKQHPPVELRTLALLHAARYLGWQDFLSPLEAMIEGWAALEQTAGRGDYSALRREDLIYAAVECTCSYLEWAQIPRLSASGLDELRARLRAGGELEGGLEIISAAWLVYSERGEGEFEIWQRQTVERLMEEVTL